MKGRTTKAHDVFSQKKKVWKNKKTNLRNKVSKEATLMTVVNYRPETLPPLKARNIC